MNKKIFYVDGSAKKNPGPGGFGVIGINKTHKQTISNNENLSLYYQYSEFCKNTTNNREELKGIIHVLKLITKQPEYIYEIYSDSSYAVNICNSWIWNWASNGWVRAKNKPIENLDLVKELYDLINFASFNYKIIKCKGHSNVLGNELADALAQKNKEKFKILIEKNKVLLNYSEL